MIKFYSTGCPKCKILHKKLESSGLPFELITDNDLILEIAEKNDLSSAPFIEVNGVVSDFTLAVKYINSELTNSEKEEADECVSCKL